MAGTTARRIGKDLSALLELPNDQLISTIRRKVESVAGYRRSASLQAFLDGRISKLRVCFHDDVQKTAFATLMHRFRAAVANGEAFPEDLRLGSMIAAGALRGDIVVDALLKSYLCKKDKEKRGCVRTGTGKFFGEDAAHEIAFSLGIAQECRSVLQLFGVSKKVVPRAFVRTENMHLLTFLFYLHLSDSPHTCILYHPVGVQAAWMKQNLLLLPIPTLNNLPCPRPEPPAQLPAVLLCPLGGPVVPEEQLCSRPALPGCEQCKETPSNDPG